MNNDDWNFLLNYAESVSLLTKEADRRRSIVLVRFRQWLRESEIPIPGKSAAKEDAELWELARQLYEYRLAKFPNADLGSWDEMHPTARSQWYAVAHEELERRKAMNRHPAGKSPESGITAPVAIPVVGEGGHQMGIMTLVPNSDGTSTGVLYRLPELPSGVVSVQLSGTDILSVGIYDACGMLIREVPPENEEVEDEPPFDENHYNYHTPSGPNPPLC